MAARKIILLLTLFVTGSVATTTTTKAAEPPSVLYQAVVFNEIESCWDLDEGAGVRVDEIGGPQAINLTDNNTVGSAPGINGQAANFSAFQSEYLGNTTSNTNNVRLKEPGWTWNFWASSGLQFAAPKAYHPLIMKGSISNLAQRPSYTIFLYPEDPSLRIRLTIADSGNIPRTYNYSNNTFNQQQWTMYTVRYQTNQIKISHNGQPATIYSHNTGFINEPSNKFFMGVGHELDFLNYYTGRLDQVNFHSEYLSDTQIDFLYNYGSGRSCEDIFIGGPLSPPPTPSPTPAPTATPAASRSEILLPSGGVAILSMDISAGDALTLVLLMVVISVMLWQIVKEFSHTAAKR